MLRHQDSNTLWVKDGTLCQAHETEYFDEHTGAQTSGIRLEQVSNRELLRHEVYWTADDARTVFLWLSRTAAIQESGVLDLILSERELHKTLAATEQSLAEEREG